MAIEIIGAGLGRTGTLSLRLALERLLGGRCYHMVELFEHPEQVVYWRQALDRGETDWGRLFDGYRATVDWAGAAFYAELAATYPSAPVLLSTRDPERWWQSYRGTVVASLRREPEDPGDPLLRAMAPIRELNIELLSRFTPDWTEKQPCLDAYARHNQRVRETIPAERLIEWSPGDGWASICARLDLPVPDEPFPHVNTRDGFRAGDFLA